MRRRSIRTLVTQPSQVCQGEYDLSEKNQAGRLAGSLPASSVACLPDRLPACLCRPRNRHEWAGLSGSSVGPWVQIFLIDSILFFSLVALFRHGCSYAVSLTQKSSDVSLVGRDQLARGYAWAWLDTYWSTGSSVGEQQRVRKSQSKPVCGRTGCWTEPSQPLAGSGRRVRMSGLAGKWLAVTM